MWTFLLSVDGRGLVMMSSTDDAGGGGLGLCLAESSRWHVCVR